MRIEKTIEISNKDIVAGIDKMSTDERVDIVERIIDKASFSNQKVNFIISSKKILDRELSEGEVAGMISECNKVLKALNNKMKKFQMEYEEIRV